MVRAAMGMARLFRLLGIGALAGLGAGFVAGGIGARLAMKAVALIAGPAARGAITKNGNRVGAFTTETVFLLVFGTMLGLFGGLLYVAVRPWLPRAGRARGPAFGALLLATCGVAVIEGENFDFHRFGIAPVNIALFAALFVLFGLLVAPLADRADRAFPALPSRRPIRPGTLAAYAVLAVGGLLGLLPIGMAVGVGLLGKGQVDPSFRIAILLFLYLLAAALVARLAMARARGRAGAAGTGDRSRRAGITSLIVLAPPPLIGLALLVRAIAAILHAAG